MKRVVITGLGAITPLGNNVDFYTPIISSFNGNFDIRNEVYGKNTLFSSSVMNEIIQKLGELVKFNNEISKNPLK